MKKTLPKLLCLVLVLALAVSFAGCGKDNKTNSSNGTVTEEPANTPSDVTTTDDSASKAVADYVAKNKSDLEAGLVYGFTESSGMDCETDIYADGTDIVIEIRVEGMDNVPSDTKKQMQDTYDSMGSTFDELASELQNEVPELTGLVLIVCEEDGDVLAKIKGNA